MKQILSEVEINNKPMFLRLKVKIGDQVVYYERANSLTLGFLTLLGACFTDGTRFEDGSYVTDSGERGLLFDTSFTPTENDTYQNEGS